MSELENSKTNKTDGSSNISKNKFNPIKEDKDGFRQDVLYGRLNPLILP